MEEIKSSARIMPENINPSAVKKTDQGPLDEKQQRRLKKACADFESLFIFNMLKSMRDTIPKSGLTNKFPGKDMYTMMMDQKIAEEMANASSGVGLQKVLYRQLLKSVQHKQVDK